MGDEAALSALVINNSEFSELEVALNVFCPFEAIGMVSQEIRHGRFLAYILNPRQPHGFGGAAISALLAAAVGASEHAGISPLEIHLADFDGARVHREWQHIDLLIEIDQLNLVVAIELKIEARESKGQLERYRKAVSGQWPNHRYLYLFLTVDGDDAEGDREHWQPLSFSLLVVELQRLLERGIGAAAARELLAAYLAMLGRHYVGNERLEELAAALWQKHRAALSFLAERQPNALSGLMAELFQLKDQIAKDISLATGLTVIVDSTVGSGTIRFAVCEWMDLADMRMARNWSASQMLILSELQLRRGQVLSAYVVLGRGEEEPRTRLYRRLLNSGHVKNPENLSPEWKRLASKTLLRMTTNDEGEGTTPDAKVVAKQFVTFVAPVLKAYDAALRAT